MPPFALISLAPNTTPSVAGSEYGLETPTRSVITPILIVSCAYALTARTASAIPAKTFRMIPLMKPS
jgi:hypothetical protein